MENSASGIDLDVVVASLRDEITRAADAARGEDLRFAVRSVRMDFTVTVERTATGSAGVKFWVVEAGAEGSRTRSDTHCLSLELEPSVVATGGNPYVSGRAAPDEE